MSTNAMQKRFSEEFKIEAVRQTQLALAPGFAMARHNYALVLDRCNRHEDALVEVESLLAADAAQSGFVDFVAQRVGTYMNDTAITIRASDVSPLLCDVEVKAPGAVGTELWTGLPRDIAQFQRIWNGAASDNPDDRDVISRARPYYDYAGRAPAVAVATGVAVLQLAPDSGGSVPSTARRPVPRWGRRRLRWRAGDRPRPP